MHFRKIIFLLVIVFCFVQTKTFAQVKDKSVFGIYGQAFLKKTGLRLDLEKRFGHTNNWVVGGVQYYNGPANLINSQENRTGGEADDMMNGFGFTLEHKIFIKPKSNGNFYVSYGPVYQQFNITFNEAWQYVEKDGLEYLVFGKVDGKHQINRFGASAVFGKKILSEVETNHTRVTFDIYAGISYKASTVKNTAPVARDFTRNINDFGYSGLHPVYGLKVGFSFSDAKKKK